MDDIKQLQTWLLNDSGSLNYIYMELSIDHFSIETILNISSGICPMETLPCFMVDKQEEPNVDSIFVHPCHECM